MAYNNTMLNCGSSARIKVFQNAIPNPDGSIPYGEGGGNGAVRNITYNTMQNTNDDCKCRQISNIGNISTVTNMTLQKT